MADETSKKLVEAIIGKPLPVTIINDKTGEKKEFLVTQPTFELLIETSRILAEIGIKEIAQVFEGKNIFDFIGTHGPKILEVISIILDRKIEYSKETYDFLSQNLTPSECYDLLSNIILKMGTSDFQNSIIKTTAMSLINQKEIIALIPKDSIRSSLQEVL
jgi:hypothetical protein